MNKPKPDFRPRFYCTICKKGFMNDLDARTCYDSTPAPLFKAGDIVTLSGSYAWNDGLDHWVVGGKGRPHPLRDFEPLQFYYVVTSVDVGNRKQADYAEHDPTYSLRTLGVFNGQPNGQRGWNRPRTHCRMTLVENPPAQVVEDAKAFIGEIYTNLL